MADELQEKDCDLVVVDGMCGNYSIIGPILASADMYGDGDFVSIDTTTDALGREWKAYRDKFIEHMGADKWEDEWKPNLMFYVHAW